MATMSILEQPVSTSLAPNVGAGSLLSPKNTTVFYARANDDLLNEILLQEFQRTLNSAIEDARENDEPLPSVRASAQAEKIAIQFIEIASKLTNYSRISKPKVVATTDPTGRIELILHWTTKPGRFVAFIDQDGRNVNLISINSDGSVVSHRQALGG